VCERVGFRVEARFKDRGDRAEAREQGGGKGTGRGKPRPYYTTVGTRITRIVGAGLAPAL